MPYLENEGETWLISANPKMYDHSTSFEHFKYVDWRQGNTKYSIGDIVFIYSTLPLQKIMYKCSVTKVKMLFNEIRDDEEYWLNATEYSKSKGGYFIRLVLIEQVDNPDLHISKLLENGLKSAPQGPQKMKPQLLEYVTKKFNDDNVEDLYPDILNEAESNYEGLRKNVVVNKYERSSIARKKCIAYHGLACNICEMTFLNSYGEIGKDFIHVHHIIPLHKIGKEYKIDYVKDLIPVCPNCHAMLHVKKQNGEEVTIDELKAIVRGNRH